MKELIKNETFKGIIKLLKPVAQILIVLIILRYTGIMNGLSFLTNSVLLKTGIMDVQAKNGTTSEAFNFDFRLKNLEGNTIDVNQFKGKVIFLNMWATWCGPCRAEMPSIQALYNKIDQKKVAFIMLSLDESDKAVAKYIEKNEFTFPVYMPAGALPKQLQIPSIPTTFIIDKEGKVVSKNVGTANYDTEKFKTFLEGLVVK